MASVIKEKKPFMKAFEELCDLYGIVDFAVVGREVDGTARKFWFAGSGKKEDMVGDFERISILVAELERLKIDMIVRSTYK